MQKGSRHFSEVRSAKISTLPREEKQFREPSPQPRKLLDHVRDVLRVNHYSVRTEEAYVGWRVSTYEAYLERDDALGRERYLKSGSGRKFLKTQLRHYLHKNPFAA
jgi:hypothetical protein